MSDPDLVTPEQRNQDLVSHLLDVFDERWPIFVAFPNTLNQKGESVLDIDLRLAKNLISTYDANLFFLHGTNCSVDGNQFADPGIRQVSNSLKFVTPDGEYNVTRPEVFSPGFSFASQLRDAIYNENPSKCGVWDTSLPTNYSVIYRTGKFYASPHIRDFSLGKAIDTVAAVYAENATALHKFPGILPDVSPDRFTRKELANLLWIEGEERRHIDLTVEGTTQPFYDFIHTMRSKHGVELLDDVCTRFYGGFIEIARSVPATDGVSIVCFGTNPETFTILTSFATTLYDSPSPLSSAAFQITNSEVVSYCNEWRSRTSKDSSFLPTPIFHL